MSMYLNLYLYPSTYLSMSICLSPIYLSTVYLPTCLPTPPPTIPPPRRFCALENPDRYSAQTQLAWLICVCLVLTLFTGLALSCNELFTHLSHECVLEGGVHFKCVFALLPASMAPSTCYSEMGGDEGREAPDGLFPVLSSWVPHLGNLPGSLQSHVYLVSHEFQCSVDSPLSESPAGQAGPGLGLGLWRIHFKTITNGCGRCCPVTVTQNENLSLRNPKWEPVKLHLQRSSPF